MRYDRFGGDFFKEKGFFLGFRGVVFLNVGMRIVLFGFWFFGDIN